MPFDGLNVISCRQFSKVSKVSKVSEVNFLHNNLWQSLSYLLFKEVLELAI